MHKTVWIVLCFWVVTGVAYATTAAKVSSPYLYNFNATGVLDEASPMSNTTSPYWWVDSGAYLLMYGDTGHTNQGSLPALDRFRVLYAANNPVDTDNGYHPQNIFRLVTSGTWNDYTEQVYLRITANELSTSPNRNQSNGILLFNRYQNAFNLYYTGVRVDGTAVIKKKMNGAYYTMALNPIFPGAYDASSSPNLIPLHTWIGLKTAVTDTATGNVNIKLYLDIGMTGHWILGAQATDDGESFGGPPIRGPAHLGIRTDFMDVQFDGFKVSA